jgi:amidase
MAFAPALFQGDGGNAVNKSIRGSDIPEPWPKVLATFDKILPFGKGDPPTVSGLWELQARRAVYLRKLLASWNASKETTGTGRRFDGILSPVMAFPTAPRYEFAHILYTALWNMADQTSVTFPAGFARSTDVKTGDEVLKAGDEKKAWDDYDPVRLDGCPIGLQIVVPRHQEEIALKLAGVATAAREKYLAK